MCKTMNINPKYAEAWTRVFNSIRNRIVISAADIDRNLKVRVIGNGTPITRANGLQVLIFNTNAMLGASLAAVVEKLKPEQFNAFVDSVAGQPNEGELVTQYLRDVQNEGNIPFTVPVTNRNIAEVGQGATADCTVAQIAIQNGPRAGEVTLALNFNRVIPAVGGTKATAAFDALMAGTGVGSSNAAAPAADPFAPSVSAGSKAATSKAAQTA